MLESASFVTLARSAGTLRELAGHAQLVLGDPTRCMVVLEGTVDCFLVEADAEGRPEGLRHYILSAGAGGVLFGIDGAEALPPVALVAVGQTGTLVAEMEVDQLRAWAADQERRTQLAPRLDGWVAGLSEGMARLITPRPRLDNLIAPGEACELPPRHRLGCRHGVAWVDLAGATPFYLDTGDIDGLGPGGLMPLAAGAWIEVAAAAAVHSCDTLGALADGRIWPALDRLHQALLDVMPLNLRLMGVDEANRLRSRDEADSRAATLGFGRLASALGEAEPGRQGHAEDDDPLVRAVAMVLHALGEAFVPPPRPKPEEGETRLTLDEILRHNRLRSRYMLMDRAWWLTDAGPFLFLPADGGPPQAILPRRQRRGYQIYDPIGNTTRALPAREAATLRGTGFALHAPLSTQAIRGRDICMALLRWARPDAVSLTICGLAAGLLNLGVPIVTGVIVDSVIPGREMERLVELGILLLLMAFVIFRLQYAVQVALVRVEGIAGRRLQAGIMDRILRLPIGFFRGYTAGNLAKRILGVEEIQKAVGGSMISSLLTGVFSLISIGLMVWYSPLLALVGLGVLTLLALVTLVLGILRVRREAAMISTMGDAAGLLLQIATAIAKLRLAAAENRAFLRWASIYARFARDNHRSGQIEDLSNVTKAAGLPLGTAAVLATVYLLDMAPGGAGGGLSLGTLLAFLVAFNQTLAGMTELATTLVQMAALQPVYAFAAPILQAVPEVNERKADPGTLSGSIEVAGVTLRYAPGLPPLFQDLSLSVAPGEFVAIVGPSGAGKSTLLRLLLGFETPEAGMVLYDGQDLHGLDVQRVRQQMGVVLQAGKLMSGSLLENILGPYLHLPESEAWWAAEQVGLAADIRQMAMGLQTVITDSGGSLSGGQVQRLMLARAIVARPRILLLDEATSALDNHAQAVVTESLGRLDATRIVVAHRLSTVVKADRIVVLKDGQVGEMGTFDELMETGTLLRGLAARQLL